jgi:hypothetical protein
VLAREVKVSRQAVQQMALSPSPGDSVAIRSRLGEADSVTNPPREWDEGKRQKGAQAAALAE